MNSTPSRLVKKTNKAVEKRHKR